MYHYVYKITNLCNNKFYIGVHSSDKPNDSYMGSGKLITSAIKKYGENNFKKDILKYFDTYELARSYEKQIITQDLIKDDMCYNLNIGGSGGSTPGHIKDFSFHRAPKSKEHREKISQSLIGKCYLGKEVIEATKERMKGNSYKLGIKESEATKVKKQKAFQSKSHREYLKASRTGQKKLVKDGISKLAKPGSEKWVKLISEGFSHGN